MAWHGMNRRESAGNARRKSANGQFVAVMGRSGEGQGDSSGDLLCPRAGISFSVKTATCRATMRGEGDDALRRWAWGVEERVELDRKL